MACKMRCPNCGTICKEQGDEMKTATGEYVVIEGEHVRKLKCLVCQNEAPVWDWKDE